MKKVSRPVLYVLFVVLALLWGLSFVFTKNALEELEPIEILSIRWVIPSIIYGLLIACGVLKVNFRGKPMKYLLLLILVEPILYANLETIGVDLTTASESSIFIGSIPLFVIPVQLLLFHRVPSRKEILGVLIGFAGVLMCIVFSPAAASGGKLPGYLVLLLTAFTGACYNGLAAKSTETFTTVEMSFAMTLAGGVFFTLQNFAMGNGLHAWQVFFCGGPIMWSVLFLGVGCSFAAYFIYNLEVGCFPPTAMSCVATNSINMVGVVAGILISGDPWGWYTVLGVGLTVVGITLAALAEKKDIKP